MKVPKSYREITVEQYQAIYPALKEEDWNQIIAILNNVSEEEVNALPLSKGLKLTKALQFLKQPIEAKVEKTFYLSGLLKSVHYTPRPKGLVKIQGKWFMPSKDVYEINTGRYNSIKTLLAENEPVDVLHHLCALTFCNVERKGLKYSWKYDGSRHNENAELFKKAPVSIAYPSVFFCSEVSLNWILNTQDYLDGVSQTETALKEAKLYGTISTPDGIGI